MIDREFDAPLDELTLSHNLLQHLRRFLNSRTARPESAIHRRDLTFETQGKCIARPPSSTAPISSAYSDLIPLHTVHLIVQFVPRCRTRYESVALIITIICNGAPDGTQHTGDHGQDEERHITAIRERTSIRGHDLGGYCVRLILQRFAAKRISLFKKTF